MLNETSDLLFDKMSDEALVYFATKKVEYSIRSVSCLKPSLQISLQEHKHDSFARKMV